MRHRVILLLFYGLGGDGEPAVHDARVPRRREVLPALHAAPLHGARGHHYHKCALLPHHAPEVAERLGEGAWKTGDGF